MADTVERLLSQTRAHASLAMWPSGEQALANALAIVDLARNFDGRAGTSFRAFVEALAEQAERGQGGEAPIVEEGTEGVRLMTVHKAKSLEFPVVILCDPTAPSKTVTAFRFTDATRKLSAHAICGCRPFELIENEELARRHDDAELVRLSYVAATRARDLLVVPTIGDLSARSVEVGWCDVLAPRALSERLRAKRSLLCPGLPAIRPLTACSVGPRRPKPRRTTQSLRDCTARSLEARSFGGIRQRCAYAHQPSAASDNRSCSPILRGRPKASLNTRSGSNVDV